MRLHVDFRCASTVNAYVTTRRRDRPMVATRAMSGWHLAPSQSTLEGEGPVDGVCSGRLGRPVKEFVDGEKFAAGAGSVGAESSDELGEPVAGVLDREGRPDPPGLVEDTYAVGLGGPVDPDVKQRNRCGQNIRPEFSWRWQRRSGDEVACRAGTARRSATRPSDTDPPPRESRARRCPDGSRGATNSGCHSDRRLVLTTRIKTMPVRMQAHQ